MMMAMTMATIMTMTMIITITLTMTMTITTLLRHPVFSTRDKWPGNNHFSNAIDPSWSIYSKDNFVPW